MTRHRNRQLLHRMDRAGRFRADRWQLGLTHLTCAKLLGVSVRTIHNWEAARARVPHAAFNWWSLAMRQAEAFRTLSRKLRQDSRSADTEGSDAGRQAGTEPLELAVVAKSLLQQVRSAPSSLPGRKARSGARRTAGDGSQGGRPKVERVPASRCSTGLAKDALSAPFCEGERGSLSLTPQSRSKSAARRTGGAS